MDLVTRGQPFDRPYLASIGIPPAKVPVLIGSGWLNQLSDNAYLLRGDKPSIEGTVAYLSRHVPHLHIAGRSALDRWGVRHYVYVRERLQLRGSKSFIFPEWTKSVLSPRYDHRPLFDSALDARYAVSALPLKHPDVMVSHRERAIIEFLADVGGEGLEHAGNLVSELRAIRPAVLQTLADHCLRRDVIRTLKTLAESEGHRWASTLRC
ncbi:type IV toxin-antitoxin system AbiEi family antitoxin domain-containing protein [Paraburkholderia azotifigens]|nr:type IV toxin-antitoxin system AbiEi family antitoxin domain-containing protein [Paraburkholderia azotifigens]